MWKEEGRQDVLYLLLPLITIRLLDAAVMRSRPSSSVPTMKCDGVSTSYYRARVDRTPSLSEGQMLLSARSRDGRSSLNAVADGMI